MKKIILSLFVISGPLLISQQITYVDFNPDSVLDYTGEIAIDIDQDFVPEIKFGMSLNAAEWAVYIASGGWEVVVENSVDWPNYARVSQLNSGVTLGLSNLWHNKNNWLIARGNDPHFLDKGPKFIGIKNEQSFATYYSWVLVELKSNPLTLIVHSAAKQQGNHNLIVGDTGSGIISLDEFNSSEVSIYPTVCDEQLTIESTEVLKSVKIYNTLGQLSAIVLDISTDLNPYIMDVSSLSPGIYTLILEDAQGDISNRKIMVKDF